jgi:hypothetical protein
MTRPAIPALAFLPLALGAHADPAEVIGAEFQLQTNGLSVSVTIRHGDTGWEDYADGWRVETADGTVLGTRVLHHPHVEEQPFTRSLTGVETPEGTAQVFLRTSTTAEGWAETVFGPFPTP